MLMEINLFYFVLKNINSFNPQNDPYEISTVKIALLLHKETGREG